MFCGFNPPRSEERVQGTKFLAGVWGLESRARCAGFSVTEIGNRKERLRDYASFPKISIYRAQRSQQGCSLSLGMLRLAEPPTGRARLRSSLKSPRNPITPFETSRVSTLHPGVYTRFREGARRVIGATAKPLYAIDGKGAGLDRRSPRPPSSREGDRPQAVEGVTRRKAFSSFIPPESYPSDTAPARAAFCG